MVAGRIAAWDTPAELKREHGVASIDELFVRLARRRESLMNALFGLLRKEIYHILRDRRTLVVLILLPIVQVVLFGYSIRTDVKDVRLAIVDPAPDATTLALRDRFNATGVFATSRSCRTTMRSSRCSSADAAQVAVVFEPASPSELARAAPARLLVDHRCDRAEHRHGASWRT